MGSAAACPAAVGYLVVMEGEGSSDDEGIRPGVRSFHVIADK